MKSLSFIFLGLLSTVIIAGNSTLGTLKFTYNNKVYSFSESAAAVEVKNGIAQLSIAGLDRIGGREFLIRGKFAVEAKISEMFLDIESSNLIAMLKQRSGDNFSLMPRYQMLKGPRLNYRGQKLADRKKRIHKKKGRNEFTPEWRQWSKAKRLKHGRGIIDNKAMSGSSFTLHLVPIYENGKLTKLKGAFSGLVGRAAKGRRFRRNSNITFGEFYLRVVQP